MVSGIRRALIARALAVLALVTLTGGQWGVLQIGTWAKMAALDAQRPVLESLAAAVSGEWLCEDCVAIQEGVDGPQLGTEWFLKAGWQIAF